MSTLYEEKRQLVAKVESQQKDLAKLAMKLAGIKMIAFDMVVKRTCAQKVESIREAFTE